MINPATEEGIARVPKGDASDVDRAVAAARTAFEGLVAVDAAGSVKGALMPLPMRSRATPRRCRASGRPNVGKPKGVADFDVEFTVDNVRFFAGATRVVEGKAAGEYVNTHTSMLRREPAGVVGQVAPWNSPLMMAIWKLVPGPRRRLHGRPEAVVDDPRCPRFASASWRPRSSRRASSTS